MKTVYWLTVATAALSIVVLAPQVGEVMQLHASNCANNVPNTHNCWIHQ